jgi:hypothetical protein
VATDRQDLYEQAFGYHDQGHTQRHKGVEIGKRSLIGVKASAVFPSGESTIWVNATPCW